MDTEQKYSSTEIKLNISNLELFLYYNNNF